MKSLSVSRWLVVTDRRVSSTRRKSDAMRHSSITHRSESDRRSANRRSRSSYEKLNRHRATKTGLGGPSVIWQYGDKLGLAPRHLCGHNGRRPLIALLMALPGIIAYCVHGCSSSNTKACRPSPLRMDVLDFRHTHTYIFPRCQSVRQVLARCTITSSSINRWDHPVASDWTPSQSVQGTTQL